MVKPLSDWTPYEVDLVLAELTDRYLSALSNKDSRMDRLHFAIGDSRKGKWFTWEKTDHETLTAALQPSADADTKNKYNDYLLAESRVRVITEKMEPYEEEYKRRPWPRAWIVPGGHVHRSNYCSSLHNGRERTPIFVQVEYSGKTEAEIVADAASRACTICFPSAPVAKPSKMELPQERQAREAREAEKAAKGITNRDGSPVIIGARFKDTIKAERTAQITYVDRAVNVRIAETRLERIQSMLRGQPEDSVVVAEVTKRQERWTADLEEAKADCEILLDALAFKRDSTVEDQRKALQPKVDAKYKKEHRYI